MTTWTMDQIAQVRRLRAELVLDAELVDRHGEDVLNEAAHEMAKCVADMAHPFGVDVDPGYRDDFEVVWERNDVTPWEAKGRLRWNPSTRAVELRGGRRDGQRYAVREVGEPFRVPRPAMTPWLDSSTEATGAALVEMADTYELVGWREDQHIWVYEAR